MKRIVSLLCLVALLTTLAIMPTSADVQQSTRDDVLVLFDGHYSDNIILQHPTASYCTLEENEEVSLWGGCSLFADMPAADEMDGFGWIGNFALMIKIVTENIVSINDYPYSELLFYNTADTGDGYNQIQINYVDPDNDQGAGDDSYNFATGIKNYNAGWHRIKHKVQDSALPGWGLNPDNIDHIRLSWLTSKDKYSEIDFYFDGLIIAKESFYEARGEAEDDMQARVDRCDVPTEESYESVKESVDLMIAKMNDNLAQFPNFMISNQEKYDEIVAAYKAIDGKAKADAIAARIDAIGEVNADNVAEKKTEIEGIDADINDFVKVQGYRRSLIENLDKLDAAKAVLARVEVEAQIDALPAASDFTADDVEALEAAKAALKALSADDQAAVSQERKDKLNTLDARIIDFQIEALPSVDDVTLEDKEAVEAAKAALEAAPEAVQQQVAGDSKEKLDALLAKIDKLENPATFGDINGDEAINASDALLALQHSVKLITLDEIQSIAADVNGDEAINASDALLILQYSVKLISVFPVEAVA